MLLLTLATAGVFLYVGWWVANTHCEVVTTHTDTALEALVVSMLLLWSNVIVGVQYVTYAERRRHITGWYRAAQWCQTLLVWILSLVAATLLVVIGANVVVVWLAGVVLLVLIVVLAHQAWQHVGYKLRSLSLVHSCVDVSDESSSLRSVAPNAVVVGGGWSFVLQQCVPDGSLVRMSRTGRFSETRWYASTTIGTVISDLRRDGRTLAGVPSIATATLGGWIFTGSHGTGGTLWTPTHGRVRVYDTRAQRVITVADKRSLFGDRISLEERRRYVILDVELHTVPDVLCDRCAFDILTTRDMQEYLTRPSLLRAIFINSSGTTAFLWLPVDATRQRRWYHVLPQLPPWVWCLFPVPYPRSWWSTTMRLSNAHMFGPTPPLLGTVASFAYINFELFLLTDVTSGQLFALTRAIQQLFASALSGRGEVRGGTGKLFLDFAITRGDHSKVFQTIASVMGASVPCALHRGKAQVNVAPLTLIDTVVHRL